MKLPHQFGKYTLIKKIAQGGMAEIYLAKYSGERGFSKDVAVKRILPVWSERKDFENMLVDEAKALVHLQHQNIVQVLELGRDDEFFYISMEYVNGVDLKHVYKKLDGRDERIPEKFACFIVAEILKALEFAHRQKDDDGGPLNIVHRDVSPQNILLSYNGEVKLTDFGIAKGLHRDQDTTVAQLKGKYAYMSPEQAMGGDVDHRSDIYSMGIVLYEILTGTRMFGSTSDFDTLTMVRKSILPCGWEARVSLNMRRMLKNALAREPEKRYQGAGDFLKDMNEYITFKKLHTHGLELSEYLTRLFADEGKEERTKEKAKKAHNTKVLSIISGGEKGQDSACHPRNSACHPRESGDPVHLNSLDPRWSLPSASSKGGSASGGKAGGGNDIYKAFARRAAALIVLFIPLLIAGVVRSGGGGDAAFLKNIGNVSSATAGLDEEIKIEKTAIGPAMPSIGGGLINIDSEPSGASGTLEYGDIKKEFTTPFVLANMELDKDVEAKVTVARDGYKTVLDNFKMNNKEAVFSKIYKLESIAPANLSVQARPWGYVTIPGIVDNKESPVSGVKIKAGKYQVKVYYTPTKTWAMADVDAKAGSNYRCLADFTSGSKMACR